MNSAIIPFLAIFFAIISIQIGAAFAKQLFPVAGAVGITAARLLIASLLLTLFWRPWRYRLNRAQCKAVLFYGLSLGSMNLCFYLAIERIPLGIAVAIEFSGPLVLAIISSRKRADLLWAAMAFLGIFLITPMAPSSGIDVVGVIFALLAALFWASYIFSGQTAVRLMHEGVTSTLGLIIAALAILPVAIIAEAHARFSLELLPQAFMVALLSSAIPYSLELLALKRLTKVTFGILMSAEPAMAAFVGLLLLGETLDAQQWAAIVLIILASFGASSSASSKSRKKPSPHEISPQAF